MKNNVKNLIEFIDHSPSCFHVIENARKQFLEHGFMELKEKEYWNLEEGKSYFVTRPHRFRILPEYSAPDW